MTVGCFGGFATYVFYTVSTSKKSDFDVIRMLDIESAEGSPPSSKTTVLTETGQAEENVESSQARVESTDAFKKNFKYGSKSVDPLSHGYIRRFGWLYGRCRSTRWWFFIFSLMFRFLQACFLGGATGRPKKHLSGILALNIIYFTLLVTLVPNEGHRNQAIAIMTCVSNIVCTSLTIALLPQIGLDRIYVQIIGFMIAIIQMLLTLAVLVLIIAGVVSSCFSLTRNRDGHGATWDESRVVTANILKE